MHSTALLTLFGAAVTAAVLMLWFSTLHQPSTPDSPKPVLPPGLNPEPSFALYDPSPEYIKRNWPRFRGPAGTGAAPDGDYPTAWDPATGSGILWKVAVPLPGHNSPIVWEDQVFLSGATARRREVYAFDAATGALRWTQPVAVSPAAADVQVMDDCGYAPSTMATDGLRVYAIFPSGDLACFDLAGHPQWTRSLGVPQNSYGYATSLAIWRQRLIVQFDQAGPDDGKSALLALDGRDGKTLWSTPRPVGSSWATPIIADMPGGPLLITCADPWVIAYDPDSGKEIWRAKCLTGEVVPSPVASNGKVFVCNDRASLAAIRADGHGDVTATHVLWTYSDDLPDIVSPLCTGPLVFMVASYGTVTCCDAQTGALLWQHDFEKQFRASPVLAAGRIYLLDFSGCMHIVPAARAFSELSTPTIPDEIRATPAFAAARIFIRGKANLYCIAATPRAATHPATLPAP